MIEHVSRRACDRPRIGAAALSTLGRAQPADAGVGFAVVGLGKLSLGQIVPGFRNCRSARLTALVSGHADKANRIAAEQHLPAGSVYSYADFDRIAADPRIDVVYIVLPNFMHAEYTIRALKAGKHVLCEKPMATTVADAEAMVAAAKAANRKLMIAYRCHTEPLNVEAMRRVRSGELGKSRLVITKMVRQSNLNDPSDAWRLDMTKSGGGALADMGIYGINGARYLLNEEPIEVRATARNRPRRPTLQDRRRLLFVGVQVPLRSDRSGLDLLRCVGHDGLRGLRRAQAHRRRSRLLLRRQPSQPRSRRRSVGNPDPRD